MMMPNYVGKNGASYYMSKTKEITVADIHNVDLNSCDDPALLKLMLLEEAAAGKLAAVMSGRYAQTIKALNKRKAHRDEKTPEKKQSVIRAIKRAAGAKLITRGDLMALWRINAVILREVQGSNVKKPIREYWVTFAELHALFKSERRLKRKIRSDCQH